MPLTHAPRLVGFSVEVSILHGESKKVVGFHTLATGVAEVAAFDFVIGGEEPPEREST